MANFYGYVGRANVALSVTLTAVSCVAAVLTMPLVLAAFQVYLSIVREKDDKAFYDVTLAQRVFVAIAYFGLVIFLGHQTYMSLNRLAALSVPLVK